MGEERYGTLVVWEAQQRCGQSWMTAVARISGDRWTNKQTNSVEKIHSVGRINNVETSYFTQLKMCYLVTMFRCPSDILITSWLKDKVRDEEKTELIYRVPCKNCSSSYVGETGRKFGLRIKEHKKKVDSFTTGTQTRASMARESSVTHKWAITDHAVEKNHVIDWDKTKLVYREAKRQTRWIRGICRYYGYL